MCNYFFSIFFLRVGCSYVHFFIHYPNRQWQYFCYEFLFSQLYFWGNHSMLVIHFFIISETINSGGSISRSVAFSSSSESFFSQLKCIIFWIFNYLYTFLIISHKNRQNIRIKNKNKHFMFIISLINNGRFTKTKIHCGKPYKACTMFNVS